MSADSPVQSRADLAPGRLLCGKYRVESVLGRGGMGVVLAGAPCRSRAKGGHQGPARRAARKPRPGRALRSGGPRRVSVEGDHVARVFDVDRLEDGTPFLVMDLLEGRDLSFVRRERVSLPTTVAVDYVLQASAAIAQAHACGVIHRDLKPANLFLTQLPDGRSRVKVLDLGISKVSGPVGSSEPSVTRTTIVMALPLSLLLRLSAQRGSAGSSSGTVRRALLARRCAPEVGRRTRPPRSGASAPQPTGW